jgi:hypothetical protein
MLVIVLGPLAGDGPFAPVDLSRRHTGNLGFPLASEQKQFANIAEGVTDLAASLPEQFDLIFA